MIGKNDFWKVLCKFLHNDKYEDLKTINDFTISKVKESLLKFNLLNEDILKFLEMANNIHDKLNNYNELDYKSSISRSARDLVTAKQSGTSEYYILDAMHNAVSYCPDYYLRHNVYNTISKLVMSEYLYAMEHAKEYCNDGINAIDCAWSKYYNKLNFIMDLQHKE